MRAPFSTCLSGCLLLVTSLPVINAITLDQFQPINGFSQACINAYNTPLSGCTASDFESGSCSTTCIAFLEALTKILNAECGGTSAYPNTLIGSFFKNEGTSTLCPNVLNGGGGASYGSTIVVGGASPSTTNVDTMASSTSPSSSSSGTLPLISAASTESSSYTPTTSSTASSAATTIQVAVVNTTVAPAAPASPSPSPSSSPSSTNTSNTKGSSTSASSTSKSTSGSSDTGGGTPLDVGSLGCHSARIEGWVLYLMAGSAGLAWLL